MRSLERLSLGLVSLLIVLAGCATVKEAPESYVEPTLTAHPEELARSMAEFVGDQCPAARSSILLIAPPSSQDNNAVTQALTTALLESGFAVVVPSTVASDAHRLQYWVTASEEGTLIRLQLDDAAAARLYALDTEGRWLAQSPFTVRH